MKRGVIFDFDGTLLDSMGMWTGIDHVFLRENGIDPPSGISDIVKKMTIHQSAAYFVERFSLNMTPEQVQDRIEALADTQYRYHLPLKEGAAELLRGLHQRGIPCCIASVTYPKLIEAALERLQIGQFIDFYVTPTHEGEGKHTPFLYHKAAARMGISAAQTVVLEDSLHAATTAKHAGYYTIGVYDSVADGDWQALCALCDRTERSLTALCDPSFYSVFA